MPPLDNLVQFETYLPAALVMRDIQRLALGCVGEVVPGVLRGLGSFDIRNEIVHRGINHGGL